MVRVVPAVSYLSEVGLLGKKEIGFEKEMEMEMEMEEANSE